ncbi:hypothetical protein [Streptomyces sp. A30]|uniref:hypothetical protein n=1 Tax=Streptomyces sp. A30 TaxID=2789273 RepID=UPI00397F4C7F
MPRGADGAPAPFLAGKKARRRAARALAARRAVALAMAQKAVLASSSFAEEFADIEAVAAHHGNNHEVLVARFYKRGRAPVFDLVGTLEFEAVSEDRRMPDALAHARAHQNATREYVSELYEGQPLNLGFASQNWQRAVRTGAGRGCWTGGASRRWSSPLWPSTCGPATWPSPARTPSPTGSISCPPGRSAGTSWRNRTRRPGCRIRPPGSPRPCAGGWRPPRRRWIPGNPDNADLVIDENGVPALRKQRAKGVSAMAEVLETEVKARMPERTLLGILSRTAY